MSTIRELEAMKTMFLADRQRAVAADDADGQRDAEYSFNECVKMIAALRRNSAIAGRIKAEQAAFANGEQDARNGLAWLANYSAVAPGLRSHYEAGFRSV